jgi:hypothetical protein
MDFMALFMAAWELIIFPLLLFFAMLAFPLIKRVDAIDISQKRGHKLSFYGYIAWHNLKHALHWCIFEKLLNKSYNPVFI